MYSPFNFFPFLIMKTKLKKKIRVVIGGDNGVNEIQSN